MSIEKIGKADPGATIDLYRQAMQQRQQQRAKESGNAVPVKNNEPPDKGGQEKVKYAPFFPVGDTQSIHKK